MRYCRSITMHVPMRAAWLPQCGTISARKLLPTASMKCRTGTTSTPTKLKFPQLEFIEPHAQQAFDLLVGAVEHHAELPPSQCIARGGKIDNNPEHSGHCANLL